MLLKDHTFLSIHVQDLSFIIKEAELEEGSSINSGSSLQILTHRSTNIASAFDANQIKSNQNLYFDK